MEAIFGECDMCHKEVTHFCKHDTGIDAIEEFKEYILRIPDQNPKIKFYKFPMFTLKKVSLEDFIKAIDDLPWNAACGPDGMSSNLIKRLKVPMAKFLQRLFKKTTKNGIFPAKLKSAFIIGIHKGGEKILPKNYL